LISTPPIFPLVRIKKDFPDALIIHIIRDLEMSRYPWISGAGPAASLDHNKALLATGLLGVDCRKGRKLGSLLHQITLKRVYEDLVNQPANSYATRRFLQHDLDTGVSAG